MHFFQVKLKLPLSKLISTLKVIGLIDFTNHFHSAEYALITNLIWAKPINDQPPQCKKSLSDFHFNFRWAESLFVFAQQKNLNLVWTPA